MALTIVLYRGCIESIELKNGKETRLSDEMAGKSCLSVFAFSELFVVCGVTQSVWTLIRNDEAKATEA